MDVNTVWSVVVEFALTHYIWAFVIINVIVFGIHAIPMFARKGFWYRVGLRMEKDPLTKEYISDPIQLLDPYSRGWVPRYIMFFGFFIHIMYVMFYVVFYRSIYKEIKEG